MNIKRIMAYGVYYGVCVLITFILQILAFGYFEKNYQTLLALSGTLLFVIIPIEKHIGSKIDENFPRK